MGILDYVEWLLDVIIILCEKYLKFFWGEFQVFYSSESNVEVLWVYK